MKRTTQRACARVLTAAATFVLFVVVSFMVVDYGVTYSQRLRDASDAAALEERAKQDDAQSPLLEAEWERQTRDSLAREARTGTAVYIVIASVAFLLTGAKWSSLLTGRALPRCEKVVAHRAAASNGARRHRRRSRHSADTLHEPCPHCQAHDDVDLTYVDEAVARHGQSEAAVIPLLQAIQAQWRYLPEPALRRVTELTEITPSRVAGVASFYTHFRHAPVGRNIIRVCHGTACHVAGAQAITDEIRRTLKIADGTDTDPTGEFTVEQVACMGCCTLAPVAQIEGSTYGHLLPDHVPQMLEDAREVGANGTDQPHPTSLSGADADLPLDGEIRIGLGSCCVAGGSGKVHAAFAEALAATGARVHLKRVGCVGMCHRTPLVEAVLPGKPSVLYAKVEPEDARQIVRRHFRPHSLSKRLTTGASAAIDSILHNGKRPPVVHRSIELRDLPVAAFLDRQQHIATEHCGTLDPTDIDEYINYGGFQALEHGIKELRPEQVIDQISRSGLRGRGGAGFPTGRKWERVRATPCQLKYVICNGDEGDPGAFMDRMIMESFPYRVIEGIALGAYGVGATEGYFYIRQEYPLAVERIRDALAECERRGYLGDDILGTGLRLKLKIMEGAGAFVCGEETALIASIEGNRGSPRLRPPFPAEAGVWGKPTLVNNVETWATVPWILRHGPEAFAELGTETSKGTKVFALAGKVARGGLIEVPMGITVGEIVNEIGGGIKDGRTFKAVQIGGPSGGCVPAEEADTPIDFEALSRVGAIMGSGGLVVLDDTDCMVDIARYFLSFTQDQSCGKCTYCRVGTRRMLDILERLCLGEGRDGDLETLEELAYAVKAGSLCGLGKTAPNPVLSTLRYFRSEYEAHLEGRCPAGKCKALIAYRVTDDCSGCTLCAQHCPAEAIPFAPYKIHEIDQDKCTRCDNCRIKCPEDAIVVESPCRA